MSEMSDELLLASPGVVPNERLDSDDRFEYPHLEAALKRAIEPSGAAE